MPELKPLDHDTATQVQKRTHYGAGCRDEACRAAQSAYMREYTARKKREAADRDAAEAPAIAPAPEQPGTAASPAPMPRPTPPPAVSRTASIGATRRLQGLVFVGHAPEHLAQELGLPVDATWWLLIGIGPTNILDRTHKTIATAFKRLREIVPPESTHKARALALAEQHGWVSPFAWDDIDQDPKPAHLSNGVAVGSRNTKKQAALKATADVADEDLRPELVRTHTELTAALAEGSRLLAQVDAVRAEAETRRSVLEQQVTEASEALGRETAAHQNTRTQLEATEQELVELGKRWQDLSAESFDLKAERAKLASTVASATMPADPDLNLPTVTPETFVETHDDRSVSVTVHLHIGGVAQQ
jgi:hypothetical protein